MMVLSYPSAAANRGGRAGLLAGAMPSRPAGHAAGDRAHPGGAEPGQGGGQALGQTGEPDEGAAKGGGAAAGRRSDRVSLGTRVQDQSADHPARQGRDAGLVGRPFRRTHFPVDEASAGRSFRLQCGRDRHAPQFGFRGSRLLPQMCAPPLMPGNNRNIISLAL
jgi:hypothetical protein